MLEGGERLAGLLQSSLQGCDAVRVDTGSGRATVQVGSTTTVNVVGKAHLGPAPCRGDCDAGNGVSVGNNLECAAGTLGTGLIIGGQRYVLSNNHVFARQNAGAIGEVIVQPGRFDSHPKCADDTPASQLGTLADFQAIDFAGNNNSIDAAVALPTTALTCATPLGFYGSPGTTVVSLTLGVDDAPAVATAAAAGHVSLVLLPSAP